MQIRVFPDEYQLARDLAELIAGALRRRPNLVLGLPTGRTPIALYAELVRRARAGAIDFTRATTFNLDEFLGLPATHPGSYRQFMERHLFAHVGLSEPSVNFLDGTAPDPAEECARYERAIEAAGGIGLQVLGIGSNGHIGFNEPASELAARTHAVRLRPETRRANAEFFGGDIAQVPEQALSMGMATILHAERLVLIATGERKAECVRRMIDGPLTTELPASFLQVHRDALVMLDAPAGARLEMEIEKFKKQKTAN